MILIPFHSSSSSPCSHGHLLQHWALEITGADRFQNTLQLSALTSARAARQGKVWPPQTSISICVGELSYGGDSPSYLPPNFISARSHLFHALDLGLQINEWGDIVLPHENIDLLDFLEQEIEKSVKPGKFSRGDSGSRVRITIFFILF